ncbi:MAG: DUF935 domain-containing protein [Tepidimonas taiwanensis]|nr:DUF935 domain-containing protein [Tepidimonas taiwanensis]
MIDRIRGDALPALGSSSAIERALSRFAWLSGGDYDDLLRQIGITRARLRALLADDEISAAVETRRHACISTPWRIEHPQSRARSFLTEALEPHAHTILSAAWEAVLFGYSVQELVFVQDGRIRIQQVVPCPFEWFAIRADGMLVWRDDQRQADGAFVVTVHDGSLRKPMGEPLLAKAYWPWFFRTHGWRMWAKFLEQAAIPLMLGKTDADKQPLLELLRTLSQGPVAVVNTTDDIAALEQPGNSPNKFAEFETAICRRIQRLILGQTLTSGTDGGSGNRALGEVHDKVRDEKRRADVRLVTGALQKAADWLADLNGLPRGRVVLEDPRGLERERAERDEILVKAGMLRFTRTYLEEKYGLEPDDFEELPPAEAAAIADVGAGGIGRAATSAPTSASGLVTLADKRPDSLKPDRRRFTAAQQALEDEIERTFGDLPSPVDDRSIASAIRAARDPQDLMERLAVVLVDADDRQFRQLFERAMFAAEIMGYAAARREAIGG